MDNTEKLLRAFIEASGFDIEEVRLSPLGLRGDELIHMNAVIGYKLTKKKPTTFKEKYAHIGSRCCIHCGLKSKHPEAGYCDDISCGGSLKA